MILSQLLECGGLLIAVSGNLREERGIFAPRGVKALGGLLHWPGISPFPQVDDQNDHCRDQQNMNQAAGNMKAETQQPEDHENRENCPKHFFLFLPIVAHPEREHRRGAALHLERDG